MCITVKEWENSGLSHDLYKNDKRRGYLQVIRNGGNGREALIDLDSVIKSDRKAKIIEMFGDPRVAETKSLLVDRLTPDPKAQEFFSNFILNDGRYLPSQKIKEYAANAMVLNAIGEIFKESVNARRKLGKANNTKFWEKAAAAVLRISNDYAHKLPKNPRTLHRIYKEYSSSGYSSLISRKFCNDNSRKVYDDIIQLLNNMFATQSFKPTYADIQRQYDGFLSGYITVINNETGEFYSPKDFTKLSPATISNYLADWDNKIATHAKRSGNRQVYMGKYKPYHSLKQPTYAGSIISIDDRQPPFEYLPLKRMWFYNGIDLASEAFTTWVYGKSKEGIILDFYRQMVRNYHDWGFNMPAELECESSLNSSFKDTFLAPGNMFEHVRIEANNARGKRIEQYFRPLRYGLEKEHSGWLARPFAKAEANQSSDEKREIIPYDSLVKQGLSDIEKWNNMPHSKHPEKTRWEYLCENQNPNLRPTNYKGIIPYIGYKTETSCNVGIVKLQRNEFLLGSDGRIATGEKLIQLMKLLEGEHLEVYWLDTNAGDVLKAYAYIGDTMMCELIKKPSYNRATIEQTPDDMENRKLMSAYVATIDGFGKRQKHKIDKVTIIDETQKTLNNKFKIPELHQNDRDSEINSKYGDLLVDEEVLQDDCNTVETAYKTSFKDRF